jgi:hypothetical protein
MQDLTQGSKSAVFDPANGEVLEIMIPHVVNIHCRIPEEYNHLIPRRDMSIGDFIKLDLPPQSGMVFAATESEDWYSYDPPRAISTRTLMSRPIPARLQSLRYLENVVKRMWDKGKRSIIDRTSSDKSERLPMWVLGYWIEMSQIVVKQTDWRASREWFEKESQVAKAPYDFPSADMVFRTFPWNIPLRRPDLPGITTHSLAELLCNKMLHEDLLDLMITHLQNRLSNEEPGVRSLHIIAPAHFYRLLLNGDRVGVFDVRPLRAVEELVKKGGRRFLWMASFIGIDHVIALQVDFHKKVIRYGMFKSLQNA